MHRPIAAFAPAAAMLIAAALLVAIPLRAARGIADSRAGLIALIAASGRRDMAAAAVDALPLLDSAVRR